MRRAGRDRKLQQRQARKRTAATPTPRKTHLDNVPNPFAGALNAKERAELQEKLVIVRAHKSCHGVGMGTWIVDTKGRRR